MKVFDKAAELVIETQFGVNSPTEDLPVFATSKLIDHLPLFTRAAVRFAEFIFVK